MSPKDRTSKLIWRFLGNCSYVPRFDKTNLLPITNKPCWMLQMQLSGEKDRVGGLVQSGRQEQLGPSTAARKRWASLPMKTHVRGGDRCDRNILRSYALDQYEWDDKAMPHSRTPIHIDGRKGQSKIRTYTQRWTQTVIFHMSLCFWKEATGNKISALCKQLIGWWHLHNFGIAFVFQESNSHRQVSDPIWSCVHQELWE